MNSAELMRSTPGTKQYPKRRAWDRAFQKRKRAARTDQQRDRDAVRDRARKAALFVKNPEKVRCQMLRANLKRKYGITPEQRDELLKSQGGRCAICKQNSAIDIDHDHSTGAIRGMLCKHCNRGLGMFKENIQALLAAIRYLKQREV